MNFDFEKFQGAGNDFIILDDRKVNFPEQDVALIKNLCDRHFGIGADGLILVRNTGQADFKMLYFNSDGRPSTLCGNGSRCVYAFANKLGIVGAKGIFEASDGIRPAAIDSEGLVCIDMPDVIKIEKREAAVFLDTGSPHHVECVAEVAKVNIQEQGAAIRYGALYFDAGSNVNFVEKINSKKFKLRTYERGVEGETLACGTGAVAAAIGVHYLKFTSLNIVSINALGGTLEVSFTYDVGQYKNIKLKGPATFVFSGNFSL